MVGLGVVLWYNLGFQKKQKLDAGNIWTDSDACYFTVHVCQFDLDMGGTLGLVTMVTYPIGVRG